MKQTVMLLHEGWHGNLENAHASEVEIGAYFHDDEFMEGKPRRKLRGVEDCAGLIRTSCAFANSKFIQIAGGLSGTLDDLVTDDYEVDVEGMPIGMAINLHDGEDEE